MLPELPPQLVAALADTPLVLLLLWMFVNLRREIAARQEMPPPPPASPAADTAREELAAFKLEVARTYVPLSLIRDLDQRLTQQLGRLEAKLDEVSRAATAAAAVSGQSVSGRSIGYGARATETEA
jgi:hypothetical protein